jgi:hypothetical protein
MLTVLPPPLGTMLTYVCRCEQIGEQKQGHISESAHLKGPSRTAPLLMVLETHEKDGQFQMTRTQKGHFIAKFSLLS